jgi:hypothetical protein
MASIEDIPPETLTTIFACLAADRPPFIHPPHVLNVQHARTHSRTNFAFSHVCRYWREVALAEPRLWTRIFGLAIAPDCLQEMIARSRDLPLILEIPCPINNAAAEWPIRRRPEPVPPFALTLAHMHRIVELDMTVRKWMFYPCENPWPWSYPISFVQDGSAPVLKRLRVDGIAHWRPPPGLPRDFLLGTAPLLESLELIHTSQYWNWQLIRLPHLKHLSVSASSNIHSHSGRAIEQDTMDQLLKALSYSPLLESIKLIDSVPLPRHSEIQHVDLPHLRHVRLQSEETRLAGLLAVLSFPADTPLRSFNAATRDPLKDSLWNEPLQNGRFRHATICTAGQSFHWTAQVDEWGIAEWGVPHSGSEITVPAAFEYAQAVDLQCKRTRVLKTLLAVSSALPFLVTLRIHGADDCIKSIRSFCKRPAELFPSLRELELAGLEDWWHPLGGPIKVTIVGELITAALGARKACGWRLLILRVSAQLSGPWIKQVVDSQLVEKIEMI